MMFPSHLLATLLVGLLVARLRPLGGREWALALAFGVAIDLDHVLMLPAYVMAHGGVQGLHLDAATFMGWGSNWQGFMHTGWALPVVLAAGLLAGRAGSGDGPSLFRALVPASFWSLHMVLDFVVARHYVVFGSLLEWVVVAGLAAAIAGLVRHDHRRLGRDVTFHGYARARVVLAATAMAAALPGGRVRTRD